MTRAPGLASIKSGAAVRPGRLEPLTAAPIFGLATRLLDVRMMKRANALFARLGLTPASAAALLLIEANPGARHGELARALAIQPPNMTKLLNQMIGEELLRREEAPADRRHATFALSPRGRRAAGKARAAMEALDAQVLSPLTADERATLIDLTTKLARALAD